MLIKIQINYMKFQSLIYLLKKVRAQVDFIRLRNMIFQSIDKQTIIWSHSSFLDKICHIIQVKLDSKIKTLPSQSSKVEVTHEKPIKTKLGPHAS